jgi:hypothetical protein
MARRVDQVERVAVAVRCTVFEAHGVGLDGDAALALDIHRIEQLLLHVAVGHGAGGLDQPVGQGGFPVVDMGDDGEIADARGIGHAIAADSTLLSERASVCGSAAASAAAAAFNRDHPETAVSTPAENWPISPV